MSTSSISIIRQQRTRALARIADYIELTKPRIGLLVLVTVAVSSYVAQWGDLKLWPTVHTLLGTFLVAASASALNQWIERRRDANMQRTENRPLPAGRLGSAEVLTFAAVTIVAGTAHLAFAVNLTTALLGLLTWLLYVWIYTPLKVHTAWNTAVGAIAGALPVMMGWAATGAAFDLRALALFTIVFLWQFPHFMAIAWIYRRQYAQAGMKMLPVVDPSGKRAGVQAVLAAVGLVPVSLIPGLLAPGTSIYLWIAMLLGIGQCLCAVRFFRRLDDDSARLLLRASLIYLPVLLGFLMLVPCI